MTTLGQKYGYNPEKHFRMALRFVRLSHIRYWYDTERKGISVHPDYQRRGLGSLLSQHCIDIVDKVGGTTYVVARPIAKLMFEKQGFELLGTEHIDMTKYGGTAEEGMIYVLARKPK